MQRPAAENADEGPRDAFDLSVRSLSVGPLDPHSWRQARILRGALRAKRYRDSRAARRQTALVARLRERSGRAEGSRRGAGSDGRDGLALAQRPGGWSRKEPACEVRDPKTFTQ